MFQRQRKLGHWTTAKEIMCQQISPQYTHNGARIACDSNGVLYIGGHFFNRTERAKPPVDGRRPVATPAVYDESIAIPPVGANMRLSGLVTDSRDTLWALMATSSAGNSDLLLSRWDGEKWVVRNLADSLPEGWVSVYGVLTIDTRDRKHVVVTAVRPDLLASTRGIYGAFGHPSSEVFHITCDPTVSDVHCRQVSPTDETVANWMPNVSQPGPFSPVEAPVILYMHGSPGRGLQTATGTETEVYCVITDAQSEAHDTLGTKAEQSASAHADRPRD